LYVERKVCERREVGLLVLLLLVLLVLCEKEPRAKSRR
jgi:hypothetical protein